MEYVFYGLLAVAFIAFVVLVIRSYRKKLASGCCGSKRNKTPLLASTINLIELNPYWNVPQSIIRKEIIPAFRRDSSYFTRNRMKVYDRNGTQLNPHDIKWSKYGENIPPDGCVRQG